MVDSSKTEKSVDIPAQMFTCQQFQLLPSAGDDSPPSSSVSLLRIHTSSSLKTSLRCPTATRVICFLNVTHNFCICVYICTYHIITRMDFHFFMVQANADAHPSYVYRPTLHTYAHKKEMSACDTMVRYRNHTYFLDSQCCGSCGS